MEQGQDFSPQTLLECANSGLWRQVPIELSNLCYSFWKWNQVHTHLRLMMVYLHFLSFIKILWLMITNSLTYLNWKLLLWPRAKLEVPLYTVLYIQLMNPKQLISSNTLLNPSGTNFETPIVVQNLSTDWSRCGLFVSPLTSLTDPLTLYTITSVCIFSILLSKHFLRCWQGEFISQSRASLVGDHFLYFHNLNV